MRIRTFEEYKQAYRKSVDTPEAFWSDVAGNFSWHKTWDKVLEWDFKDPDVKWFLNAKLNITVNCIDKHLPLRGNELAFIWEPNEPGSQGRHITYKELYEEVNRLANVLR